MIATFAFTAPTGNGNFLDSLFLTPEETLGQGLWAAYWNVLFVHTYDPVIVFYGFGTRHPFAREFDNVEVIPRAVQLSHGRGLRGQRKGHLQQHVVRGLHCRADRGRRAGARRPVWSPSTSASPPPFAKKCQRFCEPFVEIGLTNDSANTRFGVTWTF